MRVFAKKLFFVLNDGKFVGLIHFGKQQIVVHSIFVVLGLFVSVLVVQHGSIVVCH